LYLLIFLTLLYSLFGSVYILANLEFRLFKAARLIIIISNIIIMSELFYFFVIKNKKITENFKNITLPFYSLFLGFFIFEGIFMFIPRTHGVGYTLAHWIWMSTYWKPINNFGYRDNDFTDKEIINKKKIIVLGDSFAAGAAIKNINDRFSNLLEKKIPLSYKVINLGSGGSGTKNEFKRLVEFPFKPDILILQYYGNDIEDIAYSKEKWFQGFQPYLDLNKTLRPFIKYSYFLNYIYWLFPHADTKSYLNFLTSTFKDKEIMEEHLSDLNKIVEFCKKDNIPLIVVLFPFMKDTETSDLFIIPIEKFFINKNIAIVNVADLIDKIPPAKRVVNNNDPHPSVLVNRLIAEELYRTLLTKKFVVR